MKLARRIPAASDTPEELADWIESEAALSRDRLCSIEALARVLHRNGSTDALEHQDDDDDDCVATDLGSECSQARAEDAFSEMERRQRACAGAYPFELDEGSARLKRDAEASTYVFLMLLSLTQPSTGHDGTAVLFEHICTRAAFGYLGGPANRVKALRVGSPRRAPHGRLHASIDYLCKQLGEGRGCKNRNKADHTGDNHLDLVAWREWPDALGGKLIAFGQCAAGRTDWQTKLSELDGDAFVQKWFQETPWVRPIRLFFVPWQIGRSELELTSIDAGIVFDRCRIVSSIGKHDADITVPRAKLVKSLRKQLGFK